MAIYTLEINERTKTGRSILSLLKSLTNVVSISKASGLEEAMHDLETGKVHKAKDVNDLINKCLK